MRALLLAAFGVTQLSAVSPEVPSAGEVIRKAEQASLLRMGADVRARFTMEMRDPKNVTRNEQGVIQRVSFGKNRRYRRIAVYLDGPAPSSYLAWFDAYSMTDAWTFDPALDFLERTAPLPERAPFFGSDFTWEDLAGTGPDRETHEMQDPVRVNGRPCWVVASRRKARDQGYHRRVTYVDKETWITLRIEYFDANAGFKTTGRNIAVLEAKEVVRANPRTPWYVAEWNLEYLLTGRSTTLKFSAVEFDRKIPRWTLEERYLRRPPPDWVRP